MIDHTLEVSYHYHYGEPTLSDLLNDAIAARRKKGFVCMGIVPLSGASIIDSHWLLLFGKDSDGC